MSCLAVGLAFRVAVPAAAADSTATFLANLRNGVDCYDAYQTNSASGDGEWDAYKAKLAPAFEALRAQYKIQSWNARPLRSLGEFRSLTRPLGGDGGKFIDYLAKDKWETNRSGQREQIGQDYFVQFDPRTAVECDQNFRLSLSIDESLTAEERFQQLATALQTLVTDATLKASLNWLKIETPAMVRADPLLLRFCYTTPESRTAIISRVNTLLGTAFKASTKEYPPLQQRSGTVSLADYSRGYSFGSAACTYYQYFLSNAVKKSRKAGKAAIEEAITKFSEHWTSKFGPFESAFVGDLCDASVIPTGLDPSYLGCD